MYWMLLPLDSNAGRHLEEDSMPRSGYWSDLLHAGWDVVARLFSSGRR